MDTESHQFNSDQDHHESGELVDINPLTGEVVDCLSRKIGDFQDLEFRIENKLITLEGQLETKVEALKTFKLKHNGLFDESFNTEVDSNQSHVLSELSCVEDLILSTESEIETFSEQVVKMEQVLFRIRYQLWIMKQKVMRKKIVDDKVKEGEGMSFVEELKSPVNQFVFRHIEDVDSFVENHLSEDSSTNDLNFFLN